MAGNWLTRLAGSSAGKRLAGAAGERIIGSGIADTAKMAYRSAEGGRAYRTMAAIGAPGKNIAHSPRAEANVAAWANRGMKRAGIGVGLGVVGMSSAASGLRAKSAGGYTGAGTY
jgi:hypothetical protein